MALNNSFPNTINAEAMKARTTAYLQNSFPGTAVALKTTQVFFRTSYQLGQTILKPISDGQRFSVSEIF